MLLSESRCAPSRPVPSLPCSRLRAERCLPQHAVVLPGRSEADVASKPLPGKPQPGTRGVGRLGSAAQAAAGGLEPEESCVILLQGWDCSNTKITGPWQVCCVVTAPVSNCVYWKPLCSSSKRSL